MGVGMGGELSRPHGGGDLVFERAGAYGAEFAQLGRDVGGLWGTVGRRGDQEAAARACRPGVGGRRLAQQAFDSVAGGRFLGQRAFGEGALGAVVAVERLKEQCPLVTEGRVEAGRALSSQPVRYHRGGMARSGGRGWPISVQQQGSDGLSLLDAVGLPSAHLLGYPDGAVIALPAPPACEAWHSSNRS